MRIVSWNCKLALDRKWTRLQALGLDLAIVQECASPAILAARGVDLDPGRCLWTAKSNADNANKGLGVFAGEGVDIRVAPRWAEVVSRWADQPYRLDVLLPFEVTAPRRLNILAVWSFNNRGLPGRAGMPGPVLVAVDELRDWLNAAPSLVIGDFNSNVIWDRPRNANSFSRNIAALNQLGLRSVWHHVTGGVFGQEAQATHRWRADKTYHIDYAFAPDALLDGADCRIEPLEAWCGPDGVSDHAPLVLDLPTLDQQRTAA